MEKRELKMYEAPAVEVVEMEVSAPLLEGSTGDSNVPGWDVETPGGSL